MESSIIAELSKTLQIAPEYVVREYWEMVLLQEISASALGPSIVFKGGTALRLAYNSPRFSVDLDFSPLTKIVYSDFSRIMKEIDSRYKEITLKDLKDKFYTLFALFSIGEPNLKHNFSIKIELNKKLLPAAPNVFEPRLLISITSPVQVLMNTYTLAQIKKEKWEAVKTRRQPRDVFDLWYVANLERAPWQAPATDYSMLEWKNELNRLLPKKLYSVIEQLRNQQ